MGVGASDVGGALNMFDGEVCDHYAPPINCVLLTRSFICG
jgi:hypothetical protein